jgi:ABC-type sugar transport system substrate-binding protein
VLQQLKRGTIAGSVFQNAHEQGQAAVRYAVLAARGKAGEVPSPFAYQKIKLIGESEAADVPSDSLF